MMTMALLMRFQAAAALAVESAASTTVEPGSPAANEAGSKISNYHKSTGRPGDKPGLIPPAPDSTAWLYRLAKYAYLSVGLLPFLGTALPAAMAGDIKLSPAAAEVAKDIGVIDYVKRLTAARQESIAFGQKESAKANRLHDKLFDRIMLTVLQVRETISRIDDEIAESSELKDKLESKTRRKVELSEIANFMNTGTAEVISTGVGFTANNLRLPAGMVGIYGGTMEILLSALALKLEQGERVSATIKPNMLAAVVAGQNNDGRYPAAVWEYLTDPMPGSGSGESRIEALRSHWVKAGHMPAPSNLHGSRLIPILTGTVARRKALTIDLLRNRLLMLVDLRAAVSSMDRSMSEVVSYAIGADSQVD